MFEGYNVFKQTQMKLLSGECHDELTHFLLINNIHNLFTKLNYLLCHAKIIFLYIYKYILSLCKIHLEIESSEVLQVIN